MCACVRASSVPTKSSKHNRDISKVFISPVCLSVPNYYVKSLIAGWLAGWLAAWLSLSRMGQPCFPLLDLRYGVFVGAYTYGYVPYMAPV